MALTLVDMDSMSVEGLSSTVLAGSEKEAPGDLQMQAVLSGHLLNRFNWQILMRAHEVDTLEFSGLTA